MTVDRTLFTLFHPSAGTIWSGRGLHYFSCSSHIPVFSHPSFLNTACGKPPTIHFCLSGELMLGIYHSYEAKGNLILTIMTETCTSIKLTGNSSDICNSFC